MSYIERALDLLPVIIMAESFLASIPLFISGRYGSGLYWLSAGLLNLAVIFGIRKYG